MHAPKSKPYRETAIGGFKIILAIIEYHSRTQWIIYFMKLMNNCVQVDSANKHGILLEMVQVLTDLDLVISKSFISSDGGWFMDGECVQLH